MYLTYTEYQSRGGTVAESAFNKYEKQAEYKLNYWTQDRLKPETTIIDEVKDLLTEMVNRYNDYEQVDIKGVTSFSNDGVSASFSEAVTLENVHDKLYDLAVEMLPVDIINVGVI